jgi:membrane-associated phospholipid phosphatase
VTERRLVGVLVASLAAFVLVAWGYTRGGIVVRVDTDVSEWVAASMPTWAEWLARPFSWLGGWIGLTLTAAILGGELVRRGRRGTAALALACLAGAQLLTFGLKHAFDRERPQAGSAVPLPPSPSFPSGHAVTASAFFGLLVLLALASVPPGRPKLLVGAVGVTTILAIAASRVVLNVHFVSDVVAGLALGCAWLAVCLLAATALRAGAAPSRTRHEPVTHP